ncbi:GNAT family N-acetyltransferase [Acetobacter sp.]|uniref:GNAT family N-acetyltransferase n=1 Tax=Acetobacter sp. TaxID=440 RepID=UPI0039E859A6
MKIRDNRAGNRFETDVDQVTACLDYENSSESLIILQTDVPEALAGRGVGSALVSHACDVARAENLKLVSHCSFAIAWIKKNMK